MSLQPLLRPLLSAPVLALLLGGLSGCGAGSAGAHIGSSDELRAESNEGLAESDATKDKSPSSEDAAADLVESPAEPGVESEQTEPREAHLARAALHELTGDTNHLGLAFALSERTSDLHWVLA